eukprot:c25668_g1_i1.p1 GENE.c25668_g1_i1~~c25668_g1_i1.p1  ORF type:complete len:531 (+),score=134.07 c25668_g1_i1:32-1624(+)
MRTFPLVVFCATVLLAASQAPGTRAVVSQKGVDYGLSVAVPIVEAKILAVTIPGISGRSSDFDYKIENIRINKCDLTGVSTTFVAGQNMIQILVKDLQIQVHGSWSYKEHHIHVPYGSGSFDAGVSGSSTVNAAVRVQVVNGRPFVAHDATSVHIDDLKLTIHGSAMSWLYNILIGSFKSTLKGKIQSLIVDQLESFVDHEANAILKQLDLVIGLPFPAPFDDLTADLTLTSLSSANQYFAADAHGLVYNAPNQNCPLTPAPMAQVADAVATSRMATITLSPFVVNSAFWASHEAGLLTYLITPQMLPPPNVLSTNYFSVFVPQLILKYGSKNMTMQVTTTSPPALTVAANYTDGAGASVIAPANFTFSVLDGANSVEVFVLACPIQIAFEATINASVVHGEFSFLACNLTLSSSNVGGVFVSGIQFAVNLALQSLLIPMANAAIAKGFPLPTVEGLSFLSSTIVNTPDSNFLVQTDFAYRPSTWHLLASARGEGGEELDQSTHTAYARALRLKLEGAQSATSALVPNLD